MSPPPLVALPGLVKEEKMEDTMEGLAEEGQDVADDDGVEDDDCEENEEEGKDVDEFAAELKG